MQRKLKTQKKTETKKEKETRPRTKIIKTATHPILTRF